MSFPKAPTDVPASTPAFLVHEDDVPETEGRYRAPFDAESLSWERNLGRAAGTVNFGLRRERLPPGKRMSFTHAHSEEEELAYVLRGECFVRIIEPGREPREHALRAGHTVSFPAGTGIAHTFVNRGTSDCVILCFGERKDEADRVFYPEDPDYDEDMAQHHSHYHWKRD